MVNMKKDVVPIFYHVTPDDIKLKSDLYANSLTMHVTNHGKEQVQIWREALKNIPTIKGRELKTSGFTEFSRQIAKEILTKLKVKHKYEIENFVQMSDEVEAALKLLDIGSGGCLFLGIHGIGGIGKTTLAKIIFNQISDTFDCSCFLENIRENLGDLHKLQQQLLRSLDPSLRDATQIFDVMEKIKNNFTRKKVIIVLDDIDHKDHIRGLVGLLGSGSRIIFTTRNAQLHEQRISFDAHFYGLEKKEMDSKQALELFSRHAFGEDSPPKDFEDISFEAISTTGGLPLAFEVVGSFLHRRKAKVWRDMIKKLKEAPHQDVQRKLKLSYDGLDDEQQEIFLDIACFFIGVEKSNAVYMWEACEFYPNYGIEVLISMSLIKVNEKKCFWMHDQLRDLGRAIVKVNSKDARAGSRLWMHKDALDLLKRNVEKEKVEALHLEGSSSFLDLENFVSLEKLRFLRLKKCANFNGDFEGLFPKLRWLSLLNESSLSVTNLYFRELVVLELSSYGFNETWPGWGHILISEQLKVLNLSYCHELTSTPDLSKIVNLERLVLQNCGKLTSIHSSVGKLQCLRRLSFTRCGCLRKLPESVSRLVSLTRLELWCVVNLPNSIGELVKLEHLSLRDSKDLRVLPNSIGDLRSLVSLNLGGVGMTELPSSIGRLAKLESLCLSGCKGLQRLPDSIGSLHSLIDLDMSDSSVVELPHSFGNLASLKKLNLIGSSVRSLPDNFRGLDKLEMLDIGHFCEGYWIRELHGLPSGLTWLNVKRVRKIHNFSDLINLSHLEINNLVSSTWSLVLEGIEQLIKLERLSIECWDVRSLSTMWGALQQLKKLTLWCPSLEFGKCELPLSLKSLVLVVKKWGQLPINLSSLKNLSELTLANFVIEEAYSVEGLESLEVLEMSSCILKFSNFPVLKRLRDLTLKGCHSHIGASRPTVNDNDLEEQVSVIGLEFQIKLSNLKNLSMLELNNFSVHDDGSEVLAKELAASSDLQIEVSTNLKNVSKLKLASFSIHDDGFKVEGLECLGDLEMLGCTIFEFGSVSVLTSLASLRLEKCCFPTMTCLHIPSQLDHLVKLEICTCHDLIDIQGIGKLKSLTTLYICGCDSLRGIGELSELNGLASIEIYYCMEFEGIDGVDRLLSAGTLSQLDIHCCKCENVRYVSHVFFFHDGLHIPKLSESSGYIEDRRL